ncbi:MAG TPA: zf-HC2 domain-containing protein, partial [Planctomycetota bacterium]|nr:zf-HC2 domain-containing protein [Planctomycetota bacterium]
MTRDMEWTRGTPEGCGRFAESLHPHVEGELDPIRAKLLEEHLAGCAACTRAEADLRMERLALLEALVESPELPDSFSEKVMERIRDASRARRSRRRQRFAAAAAAAGLVIFLGAAGSL